MEVWKDVKDYEGLYQASNLGRVRSLDKSGEEDSRPRKGRILKPTKSGMGYYKFSLSKGGKVRHINAHRLIAKTFLGESTLTVDHLDGNKGNNRVDNLEYVSDFENKRRFATNNINHSSKHPGVSFCKRMRKFKARGQFNYKEHHLGYFSDECGAIEARLSWEQELGLR